MMFRIRVLATGGTIDKSHEPAANGLTFATPALDRLLEKLRHPDIALDYRRLMSLDSQDMADAHRATIADAVTAAIRNDEADAIIVTHGTDSIATTARVLAARSPRRPIVLTGAIRPASVHGSDGEANLAQAIVACRLVGAGVHVVFHGRVLAPEAVVKDHDRQTLIDGNAL